MRKSPFINYPGMLSVAEKIALCRMAAEVPKGGGIIEVGTSSGWTSCMLRQNAPKAELYSIDVCDKLDPEVAGRCYRDIHFFRGSSLQFVRQHPEVRCPMLFIDGSHTLLWGLADLSAIASLMPQGATVAFHDCNLRHTALQLLCDVLQDSGTLQECTQVDSMFQGRLFKQTLIPTPEIFARHIKPRRICDMKNLAAFENKMKPMVELIRTGRMRIIGKGLRGRTLAGLLEVSDDILMDSDEVEDQNAWYCICSHYEQQIAQTLLAMGIEPERIVFSREIINYGFFLDLTANHGRKLKAYFESKAGAESDTRIFGFLLNLPAEDLLWLCRFEILLEI